MMKALTGATTRIGLVFAMIALGACGTAERPADRSLGGAGIGAASGAAIGAVFGGVGAIPGAIVGAAAGGATGAVTNENQVDFGEPIWTRPMS